MFNCQEWKSLHLGFCSCSLLWLSVIVCIGCSSGIFVLHCVACCGCFDICLIVV